MDRTVSIISTLRTTLFLLFVVLSSLVAGTATAEADTHTGHEAASLLTEVHTLYSTRFDQNGKYLNDPVKKQDFTKRQLQVLQYFKSNGHVGDSFVILNTAKSELSIRVSIIKEKSEEVVGLWVERSTYDSNTESFLRLFSRQVLSGGIDLLRLAEGSVIHIQASEPKAWSLTIKYPRDYDKEQFDLLKIRILPSTIQGRHAFVNEQNISFSRITLDLWFKIFTGNFGIRGLKFE